MVANYASHVSTRITPQNEPIPGSSQVANSGGGFSWKVDCWTRLQRFLVLGSENGSYYASERKLTREAAGSIQECFKADPKRTIQMIVDVSVGGRAPKNDPAIFALALLSTHPEALEVVPQVCRIGTHLFTFVEMATQFRGWGRALRKAVAKWYTEKDAKSVAFQVTKYQNRNGWSHHDVLHQCHAKPPSKEHNLVFGYVKAGKLTGDELMSSDTVTLLAAVESAKKATSASEIVSLIRDHGLVRECIPTQWLNDRDVWAALLVNMPMHAMVRNLGKMTAIELLKPLSDESKMVREALGNVEAIRKSRLHPFAILNALSVYKEGHGLKGSLAWRPDPRIVDALDGAFYTAFDNVEPTGKRYLLGLDVSGSMGSTMQGSALSCRDASAAMAMVTARTEPEYAFVGFSRGITELKITARMTLGEVIRIISGLPFDATNCALPMIYAEQRKLKVDVFAVYTDSETNCGSIHASQALKQYRKSSGINSKLVVVGMCGNDFTIADPNDGGMMDVVGMDTSVPTVMAEFARG